MLTGVHPAATAAATVPSPPSAIGSRRGCHPVDASPMPSARASATCAAVNDPLNLSGAISARGPMMLVQHHEGGGCVRPGFGQVAELADVVQLGSHGDVGDLLQDHLHHHRDPVFG